MTRSLGIVFFLMIHLMSESSYAQAQNAPILKKRQVLETQTFWDNRDWDWYEANIPFFDSPDQQLNTTYYYRWELITKHLTYGSPTTGYTYTEFIDRPFWSGRYGAISCPSGHQLYEARWLRDRQYSWDYAKYWFETPGAQPRNYSCWLADSVWAVHQVQPDEKLIQSLFPKIVNNHQEWERSHYVPDKGMFWQTGHDDGMEININSRQTSDVVRGAPGYRPTFNAYMYADEQAIAKMARMMNNPKLAQEYDQKAKELKRLLQKNLWDSQREFFFPMAMRDETREGHTVKAGSLTYQTGKYAGNPHGRELIGYVPWMFNMPDPGYESAWKFLMDPNRFAAPFGPTTTERHDPQFQLANYCCVWSGQSWPYATTQTLVAMANLLNNYDQKHVSKSDYFQLLKTYSKTHQKNGRPYIAEGANPDTGSWEHYDSYNHSEHYFHSGFNDLIITGLVGLRPRDDETIEINPLAPESWRWWAIVDIPYKNRLVSIVWDQDGSHYGQGQGLRIIANGATIASANQIQRLKAPLPAAKNQTKTTLVNYAVNNEGYAYPKAEASWIGPNTSPQYAQDGNSWHHVSPPNRWTSQGSPNDMDWFSIDFGTPRPIEMIKLVVLDDETAIRAPENMELEQWDGQTWKPITNLSWNVTKPTGHRANTASFSRIETRKIRAILRHQPGSKSGLTEIEAWGPLNGPYRPPPGPEGNVAVNPNREGLPKVTASHTSRFDQVSMANDGIVNHRTTPHNRWTAYESTTPTDWLKVEFAKPETIDRVVLHIYDDRGGVQPPAQIQIAWLDRDGNWVNVPNPKSSPAVPTGGQANSTQFDSITTSQIRVTFTHKGQSRAGVTEIEVWRTGTKN